MSGRATATKRKLRRQARRLDHKAKALATVAKFSVEQSIEAAQDAELVAGDAIRKGSPLLMANSKALKAILTGAESNDASGSPFDAPYRGARFFNKFEARRIVAWLAIESCP